MVVVVNTNQLKDKCSQNKTVVNFKNLIKFLFIIIITVCWFFHIKIVSHLRQDICD